METMNSVRVWVHSNVLKKLLLGKGLLRSRKRLMSQKQVERGYERKSFKIFKKDE